ncbi:hypothetical protein NECAME_08073 [Necator americanus]|uniref:Uncharacterized protein n=1 Tax=Necator americanus TaxID=51031 RepID=W2TKQ5_NECAM|nr:hypothetical protein NECAME_08073 [Necator americanus]ETN82199.1 hypothetical protein NECAME_08073 [Necator americanus]
MSKKDHSNRPKTIHSWRNTKRMVGYRNC